MIYFSYLIICLGKQLLGRILPNLCQAYVLDVFQISKMTRKYPSNLTKAGQIL